MTRSMTAQEFVHKWKNSTLSERSASQQHFLDLCAMLNEKTPADLDRTGESFTFEKGADKTTGRKGFADVWKKGKFGWEYKGKHKDLDAAYQQLLTYRESLENPPLLIVSDMERIIIHTNFTNTVKKVVEVTMEDLLTPEGQEIVDKVFKEPVWFKSAKTTVGVTAEAAEQFSKLSKALRESGADPHDAAHFLIRLLFCLFAEDVGLLPRETLKRLIEVADGNPDKFATHLQNLFGTMATGGSFGFDRVPHFNGSLFDDDSVLPLDRDALDIVKNVSLMDWGQIEPSIFGTLFERSLDPAIRVPLGAHYTSKEDILLIVEPVLMRPLRRRWEEVRAKAEELLRQREVADTNRKKDNRQKELRELLLRFAGDIAETTVLDPACGSGNFLYVALRQLLDLQKEVIRFAGESGLSAFIPTVSPMQLHGIEINPYAHELASTTIWIGYIQWLRENGFGVPPEPILRRLDNINNRDALLEYGKSDETREAAWPPTDVIIGNPPFLGGKKMRGELQSEYVDNLFSAYVGKVRQECDLVCYWFYKGLQQTVQYPHCRVGLISTQAIRGGANMTVLEEIKKQGDIFFAEADRNWVLDGAIVHVSMVAFGVDVEDEALLDGKAVDKINPDLTAGVDLSVARTLQENLSLSFMGVTPSGSFYLTSEQANAWLKDTTNPNGRPNSDVVRRYFNGKDLNHRRRNVWIVDFGTSRSMEDSSEYTQPFEFVKREVKPTRDSNSRKSYREYWWRLAEPRPAMREALKSLERYIGTSMVSKHHIFDWVPRDVLPANLLILIASDDDYVMGVVHSRIHEVWARRMGTQLREAESGYRYTPTSTFETFPFPLSFRPPEDSENARAIRRTTLELINKRSRWMDVDESKAEGIGTRTLTNLYNERPTWLDIAHKNLDSAVFDAYGWPHDLDDEAILENLLALNLERSGAEEDGTG